MKLSIENIKELAPKIIESFQMEKNFLEKEIKSMAHYLDSEIENKLHSNAKEKESLAEEFSNLNLKTGKLCSLCEKKKGNLCKICRSKVCVEVKKIQVPETIAAKKNNMFKRSLGAPEKEKEKEQKEEEKEEEGFTPRGGGNKFKIRLQEARDEHFFMDDDE